MKIEEAIKTFRKVRKEYFATEQGYSNKEQLQEWRKQLVFINAELAEMTNSISSKKIFMEEQKHVVRAEEYARIEQEDAAKSGKKKSATAITSEVGGTEAYKQWTEDYSKAYGGWQGFSDTKDAIKLVIDSISSHMRNIQITDYQDPK